MSIAFAISTKKLGMVFSDGRAWRAGKHYSDDFDKTFEFDFNENHFLGCHTGILIIDGKPVSEHIEKFIKKYCDNIFKKDLKFVEKDLLDTIEKDFSKLLSKAADDEYSEDNNEAAVLIILPSYNIASFDFILDLKTKKVTSNAVIYHHLDKYTRVAIGEENPQSVILRHLIGINNFRHEYLKMLCTNTMKAALNQSEIKNGEFLVSGGTIFSKFTK